MIDISYHRFDDVYTKFIALFHNDLSLYSCKIFEISTGVDVRCVRVNAQLS